MLMAPRTDGGTIIKIEPEVRRPDLDEGDHDKFSHYCLKADITRAMVTGERIRALCGKLWTPTRDGELFPVCPTCKERKAAGWQL